MSETQETDAEWAASRRKRAAAFRLWEATLEQSRVRVTLVAAEVIGVRESGVNPDVAWLMLRDQSSLPVQGTYEHWAAKLTAYRSA